MTLLLGAVTLVLALAACGAAVGVGAVTLEWVLMDPRHRRIFVGQVREVLEWCNMPGRWRARRLAWPRRVRRATLPE